jgi:nitrate reductase NapA
MPNLTRFLGRSDKPGINDTFVVVNEVYPTLSTQYADVVLPVSLWVEREGQFGNAERRTAIFEKAVDPPGEAKWDMWVFLQVAKRVLEGERIDGKPAFDTLFGLVLDSATDDLIADQREVNKALWAEYRIFSNPDQNPAALAINNDVGGVFGAKMKMEAKQLAPYDAYLKNHGLQWPCRQVAGEWVSTKWRFSYGKQTDGFDQVGIEKYGNKGKAGDVSFYKSAGKKPSVVFRPYEPPAYSPDAEYPFWFVTGRLLEQWHTGSMTRRIPELNTALPEALLYLNPSDAAKIGIQDGDNVKVSSAYGSFEIKATTAARVDPPDGVVFAPFFAEENLINLAVEDIYCPLSKEPDYKKTVVKIEKA